MFPLCIIFVGVNFRERNPTRPAGAGCAGQSEVPGIGDGK